MEVYIREHPLEFSPNVVMRPIYQEIILPNLAYIAGPSETRYRWQLLAGFGEAGVTFPVVIPRSYNHIMLAKKHTKILDAELDIASFFLSEEKFIEYIVSQQQ